ncbi:MAG: hypothetical protein WAL63_11290 [Solirubrobacteraceae bacterium]
MFTGAERVARILTAMAAKLNVHRADRVLINGTPGLMLQLGDSTSVVSFTLDGGRITEIDVIRNPEKLRSFTGLA